MDYFMKIRFVSVSLALASSVAFVSCKKSGHEPLAKTSTNSTSASASESDREDEAVDLKATWRAGTRFVQRLEVAQNTDVFVPAMPPIKQSMTMGQDSSLHVVKERENGGREIEMRIDDVALSVFQGDREILGFDSKGETLDAGNPVAGALGAMVGGKMKFILDSSNRVEQVEGWREVVEAMSAELRGPGRAALGGMLQEDYFRQMGNFGQTLPGRRVGAGESWPSKTEVMMGPMGRVIIELTNTFKRWDQRNGKRLALLESVGTIAGQGEPGAGPTGMSMSIDGGTMRGQSWFDPERSQVVESIYDQDMTMRMTVPGSPRPGGPAPGGDRSITNRMIQRISVKLDPAGA